MMRSQTYQIPSLPPSRSSLQVQFIPSFPPSFPHTDRPPYGSTFITLRFSSFLLSAPARIIAPSPCRYVSTPRSRLAAHFQSRIHATILISHAHLPFVPLLPHNPGPYLSSFRSLQALIRD